MEAQLLISDAVGLYQCFPGTSYTHGRHIQFPSSSPATFLLPQAASPIKPASTHLERVSILQKDTFIKPYSNITSFIISLLLPEAGMLMRPVVQTETLRLRRTKGLAQFMPSGSDRVRI